MKYILITGDPVEGFEYEGPYDDERELIRLAKNELGPDESWWIAPIREPEENTSTTSRTNPAAMSDKELCKVILDSFEGKEIRHKDGNPRNYSIENLELVPIKDSSFEIFDIPEQTQRLDWWTEHQRIEREIAQSDKEKLDTKLDILESIDTADTDSFVSSLPGIDYHDIMDQIDEEDIPL
jgi:hypothetical protein